MTKEQDIFRDSFLRYLGYSNEVGEAFRPLIPRPWVTASYGLATAYVCADTVDKSVKAYQKGGNVKQIAVIAGDVFIWQMVASVIIPGTIINRITWATSRLLRMAKVRKEIRKALPTAIGLGSIPFIIRPIDEFTDYLMDCSYRKWLKNG